MCLGSPAAIAISCAWQERSIETNQNTASSTVWPTVNRPWFWWIAALPVGKAAASCLPASISNTTAPPCSVMTVWSS